MFRFDKGVTMKQVLSQLPVSQQLPVSPPLLSQSPAQQRCSPAPNCSSSTITSQHRSSGGKRSIMDLGYVTPSNHHIKASFQGHQSYSELLMETVDSDIQSCSLCQVAFPTGYPDDALIKHIDSYLENSKI